MAVVVVVRLVGVVKTMAGEQLIEHERELHCDGM